MGKPSYSFLVLFWERIFLTLEKVSVFYLIRQVLPNISRRYWFVDAWVLFNLAFSFSAVFIASFFNTNTYLLWFIVLYGFVRVFEIFVYQINVLLFHPSQTKSYTIYSYRRTIVSLMHNFFEIIFWFATSYIVFNFNFEGGLPEINPFSVIYLSLMTMVSYSNSLKSDSWSLIALFILQSQALIGLFMTLISLSRFISLFPKPKSLDERDMEEQVDLRLKEIEQALLEIKEELRSKKTKI